MRACANCAKLAPAVCVCVHGVFSQGYKNACLHACMHACMHRRQGAPASAMNHSARTPAQPTGCGCKMGGCKMNHSARMPAQPTGTNVAHMPTKHPARLLSALALPSCVTVLARNAGGSWARAICRPRGRATKSCGCRRKHGTADRFLATAGVGGLRCRASGSGCYTGRRAPYCNHSCW